MDQGLASWFAIWHPRYRATLVKLIVAGVATAGMVFVNNGLLQHLTLSLAMSSPAEGEGGSAFRALARIAGGSALWLPFLVLGLIIVVRGVRAVVISWSKRARGRLTMQSRNDLEAELLVHLLHKDDAFFSRHSPAETVNRLAVDLGRVCDRRGDVADVCWSTLMLSANVVFFLMADWRLGVVPLVACAIGALWTRRMTGRAKQIDSSYLRQDDGVKARIEDFLRAAPEVQVGRFYGEIRRFLASLQQERGSTFLRYVWLKALLDIGRTVADAVTFTVMIAVVVYMRRTGTHDAGVALVPVMIRALPYVFTDAAELMALRLDFQLASTSMARLLEYEAQGRLDDEAPAQPAAVPGPAEPLVAEGAGYRYTAPDGRRQGGIADVETTFTPGRWTAIVGGAGSGKSTLLKLLLGRLRPQEGRILYGTTPLDAIPGAQLASVFSLMPQSPALLDASVLRNLQFGRSMSDDAGGLSDADLDAIDRAGLGRICRLKALDMAPDPADGASGDEGIAEVRRRLRERLHEGCDAAVLPYEEGHADRKHWVLECLLDGRCDRERAIGVLLDEADSRALGSLLASPLGAQLTEVGRTVLRNTQRLLTSVSYHVYCQLAAFPLPERLWRLRSASVALAERPQLSPKDALALCTIALTSMPAELAGGPLAEGWTRPGTREGFAAETGRLAELLGDACRRFALGEVHPYLSWRENLVFGVVETRNSRAARLVDQAILEFASQEGMKEAFTRRGLHFGIGRVGGNLSGGQGQLVSLCRAVLRRTPVLVLDEPTSALDPASRSQVAEFLQSWKRDRIIITVSHDPEFVRRADEVKLLEAGRLIASGTFKELEEGSEAFRRTVKQT